MPEIVGTYVAVKDYELIADEVDRRVDPAVPLQIDLRHAAVLGPEPWMGVRAEIAQATEPVFIFRAREFRAACGQWVKLVLPEPFDSDDPTACPQCADLVVKTNV
jgi:hypothetical protein